MGQADVNRQITDTFRSHWLLFVLVGAGLAVVQSLRITQPLKLLASRADQIARGDLSTRVEVNSLDEIGMLAENFNYMADRLQVLLDETAAKAVLEKELELARTIQETLVPTADLIERGPVKVAGHFQPATQCGGNWWAVHDLPDNKVLIIIGDVTGHGVPAAMITAAAKAACDVGRALEGPRLTPGRLLELMNRAIFESARRKFVMTCHPQPARAHLHRSPRERIPLSLGRFGRPVLVQP